MKTITLTRCDNKTQIVFVVSNILHFKADTYNKETCTLINLVNNSGIYVTETLNYVEKLINNSD